MSRSMNIKQHTPNMLENMTKYIYVISHLHKSCFYRIAKEEDECMISKIFNLRPNFESLLSRDLGFSR
jgi:hypothetical protein